MKPVERVDFGALARPIRFGRPAAAEEQPNPEHPTAQAGGFLTRTNRRRMACMAEARAVLDVLPGEGETLHGIMTGCYDLMHLLIVLLERLGSPCSTMRIATLSLSARNVTEMAALLDAGKVKTLDLLCSDFFKRHDKEVFAELLLEFRNRGQRVASARSHCKLATLALEDGRRFTLEGSANLRTNKNQEQFALTQGANLHSFYDAWVSEMVSKHEVRQSDDPATG